MIISSLVASFLTIGAMQNPDKSFPTFSGRTGTLRTVSARPNIPDYFSLSLMGSFFSVEPFIEGKKHSRSHLRLNGNYTFDWGIPLEVFAGFGFTFNENSTATGSRTTTTLLENTDLGVRVGFPIVGNVFYLGGSGLVRFFSGTQSMRNSSGASTAKSGPFVSGELMATATVDMVDRLEDFPFRYHLNIGYRLPNGDLIGTTEDFNRFAMDSYKYQAIVGSTSFEVMTRYVKPFVEFWMEYAVGAKEDVKFKDNRKKATIGLRWTPLEVISVLAAGDIGLGGISSGNAAGIPRNPPWEIHFGVTFAADKRSIWNEDGNIRGSTLDEESGLPLDGVEVTIASETQRPQLTDLSGFYEFQRLPKGEYEIVFTKPGYEPLRKRTTIQGGADTYVDARLQKIGPKFGGLAAQVLDRSTQAPIPRAFVTISGLESPLATDNEGRFRVNRLIEGPQNIRVEAPGFLAGDFPVDIKPNETIDQQFFLDKAPPETGNCTGTIKNPDGTPLTAVITSMDGSIKPFGTDPLTGTFQVTLPPGKHSFKVQAENYLPQQMDCDVTAGQTSEMNLTLEKPKEATLVEDKIILPDAIYFEFGSATIKDESLPILDQVFKVISEAKSFKGLRVEGHTDSIGSDEYNQKLSRSRAQSVRSYLVKKGVDAQLITATGFGESKPIATNTTDEGRAENRRVEFNVNNSEESGN